MCDAKYIESFGGFLAFRNGAALRDRHRRYRVFRTHEEAMKAAHASKMDNIGKRSWCR